eukprot:Sdes_comp17133_c0_seq1m6297
MEKTNMFEPLSKKESHQNNLAQRKTIHGSLIFSEKKKNTGRESQYIDAQKKSCRHETEQKRAEKNTFTGEDAASTRKFSRGENVPKDPEDEKATRNLENPAEKDHGTTKDELKRHKKRRKHLSLWYFKSGSNSNLSTSGSNPLSQPSPPKEPSHSSKMPHDDAASWKGSYGDNRRSVGQYEWAKAELPKMDYVQSPESLITLMFATFEMESFIWIG